MRTILISFVCLCLLLGVNCSAQASPIINGSFEGNYLGKDFVTLPAGDTSITGWTVVSGSIDWIESYWQPSDGAKSIDLAGNEPGLIMTNLTTEIGKTYRVQFDMAGNPDQGYDKALITLLTISMTDSDGAVLNAFDFIQNGYNKDNMGWTTLYFDFFATSSTYELYFGNAKEGPYGAALDNVRVDQAPVPEPSTFFLLGAGLAGLGACCRRFRK
ncbi:choice-of-anchor C family protein [Geobacter pelophilus]|jgi:choice-of-anchor C domain-containing protein|uniref:Choice-of-anchor C family protein n=1 Tax=Geoanaerobacter pelophilus TaxID=60036 RepID=A0AAW4L5C4_9BACT|nr:choice-of-anchor C family protein [Geoanaerobacter pelophilus]MBT0666424.1 choice-of-anchor C family protein [Geoanaerobacter pelophilus]